MSKGRLVIKARKIHDLLGNNLITHPTLFPSNGIWAQASAVLPLPPAHLSWSEANPGRHLALSAPSLGH